LTIGFGCGFIGSEYDRQFHQMKILSCDPGASGGFAWHDGCCAMPTTDGDVVDFLRSKRAEGFDTLVIEDVGGFCGTGQPGSAMFKFGRGCGVIHGAAMAMGFRVELVKPQKWQKHFALGTVKSAGGKTAWKNKLKAEAQRRFPNHAVTLKTADALLIYECAVNR
jgi:hypothetical protein